MPNPGSTRVTEWFSSERLMPMSNIRSYPLRDVIIGEQNQGQLTDTLEDRLIRCFSSVFPEKDGEGIRSADLARLADVDSLAAVTLLTLIDEEFGVDLDLEGLLGLGNYDGVRQHLLQDEASKVPPSDQRQE
jgi:acyl carrier protein